MSILNEARRPGEFMMPYNLDEIHRAKVTFTGTAVPGQIVGKTDASSATPDAGYVPFDQDLADGSEDASGIMWGHADDLTAGEVVIVRRGPCDVNGYDLVWPDDITSNEQIAAEAALLANFGIRVRYNA